MSAVHAAMTALVVTRAELDADEGEGPAEKLARVARGFDYLVMQLAAVGLECIESHDQPSCGTCGRPMLARGADS